MKPCKKCKKCSQKQAIAIWKQDWKTHLIYESDEYCIDCFFECYETEISPTKYKKKKKEKTLQDWMEVDSIQEPHGDL